MLGEKNEDLHVSLQVREERILSDNQFDNRNINQSDNQSNDGESFVPEDYDEEQQEQRYMKKSSQLSKMRTSMIKTSLISENLIENDPAGDALAMEKNSSLKNAANRTPAIFITMGLEMIVATVIASFTDTLTDNQLLMAFMPVISAISGNVGLQSSSINVRALAVGILNEKQMCYGVKKQGIISIWLGMFSGFALGVIAGLWQQFSKNDSKYQGWYSIKFGLVIFGCQWIAAISAGIFGAWSPLLFKRFRIDPGNIAGPLETAFQDIVGYTSLLLIASQIL